MKIKHSGLRSLFLGSAIIAAAPCLLAQDIYWNQNGVAAGLGTSGGWITGATIVFSTLPADTAANATVTTTTANTLNVGTSTAGFAGGTLTLTGTQSIGSIITGSANTTAGVSIVGGTLVFAASGTVTNNSGQGLIIDSVISVTSATTRLDLNAGTGGITMSGSANTYSGITFINTGTVVTNNVASLGASGSDANRTVVASGARLAFNNTSRTYTERFEIAGAGVGGTTGALTNGQTTTNLNGIVSLSGAATIHNSAGTLTIGSAATTGGISLGSNALTFNAAGGTITVSNTGISGASGSVVKSGASTLNLNVGSSYGGGTTVSAGTLNLGNTTALGSTSGQLTVDGGTLNLAANSVTVGNLTGAGGIISGNGANRTLTIGQGDTGGGNFLGAINNGANGTTALTKTGSGTIKLGSTSGYTGATAVSGGTLVINGNISTSVTTVRNAATLAGTGTVGTTTIQTTGILAPGDGGIESLNTGALTLNSGSISNFEINTSGDIADLAISSALLTFGGTLNVTNIGGSLMLNDTFNLFDWNSTAGTFSTVNLPVLGSGLAWNTDNLYTTGTIIVAVPEPSAALLGGLSMLLLLRRRR